MAISPNLVKEWYKDLSVEELEQKYKTLESNYYFETKEKQIKCILGNFMNASYRTNTDSECKGIEELLKEKTGKTYKMKRKMFKLTTNDFIEYLSKVDSKINRALLFDFFKAIKNVDDEEKQWLLVCLSQEEKIFFQFLKDLNTKQDINNLFEKYSEIASEYYSNYRRIG